MTEKRFPPPGNEAGYREAAAPVTAPEPQAAPVVRPHVVATRPDDPDDALRKASIDENRVRRQNAEVAARLAAARRGTLIGIIVVAVYIALSMAGRFLFPRRRW